MNIRKCEPVLGAAMTDTLPRRYQELEIGMLVDRLTAIVDVDQLRDLRASEVFGPHRIPAQAWFRISDPPGNARISANINAC